MTDSLIIYRRPRFLSSRSALFFPAAQEAAPTTIFSQALDTDTTGFEDATCRVIVPVTGGSGALNQLRVTFQASAASGSFQVDNCSCGVWTGTDADTTATPIELLKNAASGFTAAQGTDLLTDWASSFPTFADTDDLVVIFDLAASNGNFHTVTGLATFPPTLFVKAATNSYNLATTPASSSNFNNRVDGFIKIEVR